MTLAQYAGNALPHLPLNPWTDAMAVNEWRSSAWLSHQGARWCGKCLRENDKRWPLRWLLPWTFACLEHNVYLSTECLRCLSPVYFDRHGGLPRECGARVAVERAAQYRREETCEFPITMDRPIPVSDDSVLRLQERINTWLDGRPAEADRQLVAVVAVMIFLVTPTMMHRRGADPALVCALRSGRGTGLVQERRLWADPLRVAAAADVADRILRRTAAPAEVAERISDFRSISYRDDPWQLDVMDWAYGSALRPNPYVDELVSRGVITIGAFRRSWW
jgi:hypothetical protein